MATMTLLEMTQNILSAMDSDNVNSISDTEESEQVATIIKETYFDIISQRDWPFLRELTTLTALGDSNYPTKMRFPTTTNKIIWIKYNKKDVSYLSPKEFKDLLDGRTVATGIVDSNGYGLDHDPEYWTSYDDDYVFFDSIDTDVDSTLQASKSSAYVITNPTWTHTDAGVPDMPDRMFPMLLADAKGTCFLNLKQTANAKEERKAQRLKVRLAREIQKNEQAESKTNSGVNYGRT